MVDQNGTATAVAPVSIGDLSLRVCQAGKSADSVVLGCAGMADFCEEISREIGVPVIDGVVAGVKLIESLVALRLTTSRRDEFAPPPPKPYSGLLAPFERAPVGDRLLQRLG